MERLPKLANRFLLRYALLIARNKIDAEVKLAHKKVETLCHKIHQPPACHSRNVGKTARAAWRRSAAEEARVESSAAIRRKALISIRTNYICWELPLIPQVIEQAHSETGYRRPFPAQRLANISPTTALGVVIGACSHHRQQREAL